MAGRGGELTRRRAVVAAPPQAALREQARQLCGSLDAAEVRLLEARRARLPAILRQVGAVESMPPPFWAPTSCCQPCPLDVQCCRCGTPPTNLTPAAAPAPAPQVAKDFTEELAVYSSSRRSLSRLEQWSKQLPLSPIRRDSRS